MINTLFLIKTNKNDNNEHGKYLVKLGEAFACFCFGE